MPGKTANNKGSKKNRRSPGRRVHLPLVSMPPASKRVLLSSVNNVFIAESATGLGASYFFRLNSVFDPDATGVGAVATGYNTWAGLFLSYKVHRVTVRTTVFVSGGTAASTTAMTVVAPLAYQAVIPSSVNTWRLIPGAKSKMISPLSVGGANRAEFVDTYDLAKVLRVTKAQYNNDMDFSGLVGTNPVRQAYYFVGFNGIGSSSVVTMTAVVQLTYEVEWFNPVPMQ